MALIKCPDCGKKISDQAPTCPNCGRPIKLTHASPGFTIADENNGKDYKWTPAKKGCGCLLVVMGAFYLIALIGSQGSPPDKYFPGEYPESIGPLTKDWAAIVQVHGKKAFKDPDSVKLKFDDMRGKLPPCRVFVNGKPLTQGYCGTVQVNAKNSFGAFTGQRPFLFVVKGGRLEYIAEEVGNHRVEIIKPEEYKKKLPGANNGQQKNAQGGTSNQLSGAINPSSVQTHEDEDIKAAEQEVYRQRNASWADIKTNPDGFPLIMQHYGYTIGIAEGFGINVKAKKGILFKVIKPGSIAYDKYFQPEYKSALVLSKSTKVTPDIFEAAEREYDRLNIGP